MSQAKTKSSQLSKLRQKADEFKLRFHSTHQNSSDWLKKRAIDVSQLRDRSNKLITAGSLAGSMLASQASVDAQVLAKLQSQAQEDKNLVSDIGQDEYQTIIDKMRAFTLMPVGHLPEEDELYLEQQLSDLLGFDVTAELEGHRLNHSVGIMGGEQHLKRFPTDDIFQHDAYQEAGMAPNRGAFSWFAEGELTQEAIEMEKYYFAVQTLYLPDWNTNHAELKPWYKFRKMIVINPADELAVVGVVGDAGPALWVKKQFGGSPEIIREAKIWSAQAKGRVILLFVDDPDNEIPLGVIDLKTLVQEIN